MKYIRTLKNRKVKIIHVDDHALFRYGLRNALKGRTDVEIIGEAGNGKELLELLNTVMPDIVVMNITMPVMNGIETLPRIRSKYPDLKVIILSMHNDPAMITKMMQLGASSYLTKNTSGEKIYQAIRCVFEYDYYYSEPIETAYLGSDLEFERHGHEYTYKELQVLNLHKEKRTVEEIAHLMDISETTVSAMMDKLKRKLNQEGLA